MTEPAHEAGLAANRRDFMKLMAASLAFGGVGACTRPSETVVPYVKSPPYADDEQPLYFATAMSLQGCGLGLLVESRMGRPTKVEGNPLHPASGGGTDVFAQASVLELWDPDRSRAFAGGGRVRDWPELRTLLGAAAERARRRSGAGLRLLTGAISSPTLLAQLDGLLAALPEARWHCHEALGADHEAVASRRAFGADLAVQLHLAAADVIVSLDADLLADGAARVRHARDFSARRDVDATEPNRLYVIESSPTVTGAAADHRLALRSRELERFARRIATLLHVEGMATAALPEPQESFAAAVAADLAQHRGRALVVAGRRQPPAVHLIVHAVNATLAAVGATLAYTAAPTRAARDDETLAALVDAMTAGEVDTLLISGTNPALTAPADLDFAGAVTKVGTTIQHGLYADETAAVAGWHVPDRHFLESWSDVRAFDGSASIVQPLIAPLYAGRSLHELVALLAGSEPTTDYERVRAHWRGVAGADGFEALWSRALHEGVVPDTAFATRQPTVAVQPLADAGHEDGGEAGALELAFAPDASVWDGRFANNGWLQELPRPLTTLTWDNAAIVSPALAERLTLRSGDVVELRRGEQRVAAPVLVLPGQAADVVTVHLGYGRRAAGHVGNGVGFDAYALRHSAAPWFDSGLTLRPTGQRHVLATTQHHHAMEGRDLVRRTTLADFNAAPAPLAAHPPPSLYAARPAGEHAWGMAIDLNRCIGCNACTIACQAENNIPIVGQREVANGREMHWIRVDTYFEETPQAARFHVQPVPCMHCEDAPCEVVCPVGATLHDSDGLNLQVYNRCIGTRFCSNNCPYKVRRFNFFDYAGNSSASLNAQHNPEVTVRSRGVMEKCTYCVQRIAAGRAAAELRGAPLRDGEVVTACQAACPSEAIVFGDLGDPASAVSAAKRSRRHYVLLEEENTRPRTTYLAKVRNPNPDLPS